MKERDAEGVSGCEVDGRLQLRDHDAACVGNLRRVAAWPSVSGGMIRRYA